MADEVADEMADEAADEGSWRDHQRGVHTCMCGMISYTDAGKQVGWRLRRGMGEQGWFVCAQTRAEQDQGKRRGAGPWTTAVCCTGSTTTPRI